MPPDNSLRANLNNHQGQLIACKLSTPELQQRKATVIAGMRRQILERSTLEDGIAFKFNGTDQMLDELLAFIKTERACCSFFSFTLSIESHHVWLTICGPEGVNVFIASGLEL
jgi:hypothetical protein